MCDPQMKDLLEQFSKTALAPVGVSFRGKGLKLHTTEDAAEVVKSIRATPDMTYLDLEGNTLGVDAAKAIGDALKDRPKLTRALWKDMFTGRMKTEIPKALTFLGDGLKAANARLTELDLSDNAFGPIGVEALATLLNSPVCYTLQELRLNNNGLGITGGKMLAEALLAAHTNSLRAHQPLALKVFIAGRNRLENDGATALSKVFKAVGSLEELSMPQNGIYHKGISALSDALKSNNNLRVLNLNDNTLTVKGAVSLAAALPHLPTLTTLNLGDCLLKTAGALAIAQPLTSLHHIQEIQLDSNEIGCEGGVAIARAVSNKTQLNKLVLTGNAFGPAGRKSVHAEVAKFPSSDVLECPSDEDEEIASDEEDEDNESEESSSDEEEEEEETEAKTSEVSGDGGQAPAPVPAGSTSSSVDATILQFLMEPTPDNFNRLFDNNVDSVIESLRIPPGCMDVETCVKLIMKVSSLTSCKMESVRTRSRDIAIHLYRALFAWADSQHQLSAVNNVLFVYLQLIKDEDSLVKVSWDVGRCVEVLQAAIATNCVPTFTQHILTCCLDRNNLPTTTTTTTTHHHITL